MRQEDVRFNRVTESCVATYYNESSQASVHEGDAHVDTFTSNAP